MRLTCVDCTLAVPRHSDSRDVKTSDFEREWKRKLYTSKEGRTRAQTNWMLWHKMSSSGTTTTKITHPPTHRKQERKDEGNQKRTDSLKKWTGDKHIWCRNVQMFTSVSRLLSKSAISWGENCICILYTVYYQNNSASRQAAMRVILMFH